LTSVFATCITLIPSRFSRERDRLKGEASDAVTLRLRATAGGFEVAITPFAEAERLAKEVERLS
jgi:hypothetical protein